MKINVEYEKWALNNFLCYVNRIREEKIEKWIRRHHPKISNPEILGKCGPNLSHHLCPSPIISFMSFTPYLFNNFKDGPHLTINSYILYVNKHALKIKFTRKSFATSSTSNPYPKFIQIYLTSSFYSIPVTSAKIFMNGRLVEA